MSAADRLDQIEARLDHTGYHRHKDDTYALVATLRAVLKLHAPRWYSNGTKVICRACGDTETPCATVRAVEEALS